MGESDSSADKREKKGEMQADIMESKNIKIKSGDSASKELREYAVQFLIEAKDIEEFEKVAAGLQSGLQKKFGGKWNVVIGELFVGKIWSNKEFSLGISIGKVLVSIFKSE